MSKSSSIIKVELNQPGRFPTSRFGGVVWTRRQGETMRQMISDEETADTDGETDDSGANNTDIGDKFNQPT